MTDAYVVSAKACLFGADDVVDDIGQEDAAYREELIGKGKQTADIDRRLRPDRTYICPIREYVWLFPRDCAAWKQLEIGPPCALPLNTAMGGACSYWSDSCHMALNIYKCGH